MAGPYIAIQKEFWDSVKTLRLVKDLGENSEIHIIKLWAMVQQKCPDGNLSQIEPWIIEKWANWKGCEGKFFDACLKHGFLNSWSLFDSYDDENDLYAYGMSDWIYDLKVHDWWDNAGRFLYANALKNKRSVTKEEFGFTGNREEPDRNPDGTRPEPDRNPDGKEPVSISESISESSLREYSGVPSYSCRQDVSNRSDSQQHEQGSMQFPCRVSNQCPEGVWTLTPEKLAEYRESYPQIPDLEGELRSARQWLRDHPGRLKTARGMGAFLGNWLRRPAPNGRHNPPPEEEEEFT